jgi:hypothetical protein
MIWPMRSEKRKAGCGEALTATAMQGYFPTGAQCLSRRWNLCEVVVVPTLSVTAVVWYLSPILCRFLVMIAVHSFHVSAS